MHLIRKFLFPVLLLVCLAGIASAADDPPADGPLPVADFQLADFQGRVVLVDFWASWCVPCKASLPWLNAMQRKYGDRGLQVVMIDLDRDPAAAAKMSADIETGIRQFLDPAGELATRYELEGMPSSYLYDRTGTLVSSHIGFLKTDGPEREQALAALLESGEE